MDATDAARSDAYGIGALVLAYSLRESGTEHGLVCMHTAGVGGLMLDRLRDAFDELIPVDEIHSDSHDNLRLLGRPELFVTFSKINVWRLTQYARCVFLDADTLVLRNVDDLFSHDELSAAPDNGWPDCFNSGVFVCSPSVDTFNAITAMAATHGSFDGGDQGLLNQYFNHWKRLPFAYNVTPGTAYGYTPAYKYYKNDIKIIHYTGMDKPWKWERLNTGAVIPKSNFPTETAELVQIWWEVHDRHISRWDTSAYYKPDTQNRVGGPLDRASAPDNNNNLAMPTQFSKSRYDWNEKELAAKPIQEPVDPPASAAFSKPRSNSQVSAGNVDDDDLEDDKGSRKLPLKSKLFGFFRRA